MMKRVISLALAVLMIAALFVGCSSGPEGTYKIKTVDGQEYSAYVDMLVGMFAAFGGDQSGMDTDQIKALFEKAGSITLKADGVVEMFDVDSDTMTETTKTGTWKLDGDKITITANGETMEGTIKDGEITITVDGHSMILVK